MHAHRVEVLDRADDHDVVGAVADDLELELVPAAHRLLDEHLADRALGEPALDLRCAARSRVVSEAAAVAAERERRPDDGGRREPVELAELGDDHASRRRAGRTLSTALLEELAVLGAVDHVDCRADQLDPELRRGRPPSCELAREVERGLAAHRRQQRVGPLAAQHAGDAFEVERLEVGRGRRSPGRS